MPTPISPRTRVTEIRKVSNLCKSRPENPGGSFIFKLAHFIATFLAEVYFNTNSIIK